MWNLANPRWMYVKAALLLMAGLLSSVLILIQLPSLRTAALLTLAVWCFARFYYFAFYVIHHYIDPTFHFSGLSSALLHVMSHRQASR